MINGNANFAKKRGRDSWRSYRTWSTLRKPNTWSKLTNQTVKRWPRTERGQAKVLNFQIKLRDVHGATEYVRSVFGLRARSAGNSWQRHISEWILRCKRINSAYPGKLLALCGFVSSEYPILRATRGRTLHAAVRSAVVKVHNALPKKMNE